MDKSFIEKRIESKVEEKLEKEWQDLRCAIGKSKIGQHLKIKDEKLVTDYFDGHTSAVFNKDFTAEGTNLEEIINYRRKELLKEETDNLLNKLENLGYLFNQ